MKALVIETTDGVGDSFTVGVLFCGTVSIEIDKPWSGDTETGFGRHASWDLTLEQVVQVCDHLDAIIAENRHLLRQAAE